MPDQVTPPLPPRNRFAIDAAEDPRDGEIQELKTRLTQEARRRYEERVSAAVAGCALPAFPYRISHLRIDGLWFVEKATVESARISMSLDHQLTAAFWDALTARAEVIWRGIGDVIPMTQGGPTRSTFGTYRAAERWLKIYLSGRFEEHTYFNAAGEREPGEPAS